MVVAAPLHAASHAHADKKAEAKAATKPIPKEDAAISHGSVSVHGHAVHYTATAGHLLIRNDDGDATATVFYVAYTADGARAGTRPVTFLYNGGPGSSTIWLHMGSFGPVRVKTLNAKTIPAPPYTLEPNKNTLLDKTDLVFIDAIGTGFSHAVGKAKNKDFWGVDQDVDAFARFIRRYITVNQRWNSPKYLIGESYGTTRSAALSLHLQNMGIALNGITLVSSILNYGIDMPGSDMSYQLYLPSFAAIAWYHDKLPNKPADLAAFVQKVCHFADTEYANALAEGDNLPAAERDAIAQKLHQYTGLSVKYLKETDLRISIGRFRKQLLRDQAITMGRYDARYEGEDADSAGERPDYDPSDSAVSPAFIATFNQYLDHTLHYQHDKPYNVMASAIRHWDWKHSAPGGHGWKMPMPYVAGDLAQAMRENPSLHVFSANGWFDLATPFHATEYDLNHMTLPAKLHSQVHFAYYPSGHMIYLNPKALGELSADLDTFYDSTH
ncbi:peptidase S10 [Oleiagrimonas sp. C23AA]|nr:peptidase S10 [Oleiagrimonas sp. C23AA]NII11138.1 peptidase S10 [Oleiagrimonas sp. C23AA]